MSSSRCILLLLFLFSIDPALAQRSRLGGAASLLDDTDGEIESRVDDILPHLDESQLQQLRSSLEGFRPFRSLWSYWGRNTDTGAGGLFLGLTGFAGVGGSMMIGKFFLGATMGLGSIAGLWLGGAAAGVGLLYASWAYQYYRWTRPRELDKLRDVISQLEKATGRGEFRGSGDEHRISLLEEVSDTTVH